MVAQLSVGHRVAAHARDERGVTGSMAEPTPLAEWGRIAAHFVHVDDEPEVGAEDERTSRSAQAKVARSTSTWRTHDRIPAFWVLCGFDDPPTPGGAPLDDARREPDEPPTAAEATP